MSGTGEALTHTFLCGVSRAELDGTLTRLLQPVLSNSSRPIVTLHVGNNLSSDPATVSRSTVQGRPQILVSEQQRQTMYTTYNVAYGGVEPLRVWEGDISLSHVLSALGCIGEPNTHPLGAGFVYRIQSILTKAGKSALWKSFCDLEESGEWSSAEAHFLRARRRCLQPFVDRLREDLPERIVVDLTDPVLRSLRLDTVLFSIFVDRLIQDQVNPVIVCSNAHKYFTTQMPDAFCDTILSILRGRELGTVILSTQDPTVVPPEIISLMDLILCHRFTSNLWIQYLQANFGLGTTQDLQHRLTCLEPNSGIAIFASGRLVDYGNSVHQDPNIKASGSYERSLPLDHSRVTADISPPGTSSSVTLNVPEITLAPPPGLTVNLQSSYLNAARPTSSGILTSPTAGTDTTASTAPNPLPPKTPMKRFRMLFIAIEAIYVMLNLKAKKVPMSALITRLTEEDLSRMQVASANEAVEKAQEAGFIKVENGFGTSGLISFATDDVKVMLDTKPVENALRQNENETVIHVDRLGKRENIMNAAKNSGFATFQEYLRVAESRGLLKLNASKTMVSLPGTSAGSSNPSTSKVNDIARQFASMSSKDREALARVLKG